MQQGNVGVLRSNEPPYDFRYTHEMNPRLFGNIGLSEQNETQSKKTILLMNCAPNVANQIKWGLSSEMYDVLNAVDTNLTSDTIRSLNPFLLILGVDKVDDESLQRIAAVTTHPFMVNTPLVIVSDSQLSVAAIDKLFAAGATDFLLNPNDRARLKRRMKAILQQTRTLYEYKMRERKVREENSKLANDFVQLHDKAESQQRESLTHLELLIHTKELNETIVNKITDLTPYLNVHGKAKLKQLTRQLKWDLKEEEDLNFERKFDESNHHFYALLYAECAELTRYEMRLCAYLQSNNSSAEIARITRKTSNCINVAFARIRSKIGITNNKELGKFLNDLLANSSREKVLVSE